MNTKAPVPSPWWLREKAVWAMYWAAAERLRVAMLFRPNLTEEEQNAALDLELMRALQSRVGRLGPIWGFGGRQVIAGRLLPPSGDS